MSVAITEIAESNLTGGNFFAAGNLCHQKIQLCVVCENLIVSITFATLCETSELTTFRNDESEVFSDAEIKPK